MSDDDTLGPSSKQWPLYTLLIDQARVDESVRTSTYAGAGTTEDPFIVDWIVNDGGNPLNWSKSRRWAMTMSSALTCFVVAFGSSAYTGVMTELMMNFKASQLLITGGVSLYVLGFALGPLLWAPLSEIFGRQYVFIGSYLAFVVFCAATTADYNVASLLVFRFFAGAFGSGPLTNAGGVISDLFYADDRSIAIGVFSLAPAMGPTFGPFIGGYLGTDAGWRWVMGLVAILAGVSWIINVIVVPETYAPVLLKRRSEKLSKETGKVYKTVIDIQNGGSTHTKVLMTSLLRPCELLVVEPIVLFLSIYTAVVYGVLYLLFGAYPVVFQLERGWSPGKGGLPFLGIAIGMFIAVPSVLIINKWYVKEAAKTPDGLLEPEARLVGGIIGGITVPIGMFWFAWTTYESIHWLCPVAAGIPFGFGMTLIFQSVFAYLADAYGIYSASALAANTVLRSLFGAGFPMFTKKMYENLGTQWASSVPGFLGVACIPVPVILYIYGQKIRQKCKYASQTVGKSG
ncbi:unnamed protein product [Clonostachys rosea]|uniref:Major facilitator superfamily (MFS) profile domain-containing protein n=1 Tax=Bionectria ochroleuca TaxID=29856 RepID=A0ABY6U8D3_BIOOC|nr:unnamed protein product [Clonostachys rosea]